MPNEIIRVVEAMGNFGPRPWRVRFPKGADWSDVGRPTSDILMETLDQVTEQVKKGDSKKALETLKVARDYADFIGDEWPKLQSNYQVYVSSLLRFIGQTYGEDAMFNATMFSADEFQMKHYNVPKQMKLLTPQERIAVWIDYCRNLGGGFLPMGEEIPRGGLKVVEDDEKITVFMGPCGSGGRNKAEKRYRDIHTREFAGRKNMLTYCVHCPMSEEILPVMYGVEGVPLITTFNDDVMSWNDKSGQPMTGGWCGRVLYKRKEDVPKEYMDRIYEEIERYKKTGKWGKERTDPQKEADLSSSQIRFAKGTH